VLLVSAEIKSRTNTVFICEVVFGELTSGMEVLDEVEKHGTTGGAPNVPITITDCGIYQPLSSPGAGYWYDQPDAESYSGVSPAFIVRPRVVCLAPSQDALEKFRNVLGSFCHIVSELEGDKLDATAQATAISKLLGGFSVDVALIAPACRAVKASIVLPAFWRENNLSVDEVVLEAKPIDALASIHSGSWMANRSTWQLDGKL
jgi:hypothetical protein